MDTSLITHGDEGIAFHWSSPRAHPGVEMRAFIHQSLNFRSKRSSLYISMVMRTDLEISLERYHTVFQDAHKDDAADDDHPVKMIQVSRMGRADITPYPLIL